MNKVILILAMHRSGTSALTRVMSLMGAALPKSILGKNSSNLRGHWESEAMISAHEQLLEYHGSAWADWRRFKIGKAGSRSERRANEIFIGTFESEFSGENEICVVKEPRICRFATPYINALEDAGAEVHSLIMVRNPLEVAASLTDRDGLTKLDGLYLWLTSMLEADLATRNGSRQFIAYNDFLETPIQIAKAIKKASPFPLPYKVNDVKKQINSYVSPSLKRQNCAVEDIALDPIARGWVSGAYEAFLVLCENPKSKSALAKLDSIRNSYFSLIEPLHDILSYERARLDAGYQEGLATQIYEHQAAVDKVQHDHEVAWRLRDEETAQTLLQRETEKQHSIETLKLAQFGEMQYLKAQFDSLKEEYDCHKVEHHSLKEEYDCLKGEHHSLKEEYDCLKVVQHSFKEEYDSLKGEHHSLKEEYDRFKGEHHSLKEEYDRLKVVQHSFKEEYDSLKGEHHSLKEECDYLKEERHGLKGDHHDLKDEYDGLKFAYENAQASFKQNLAEQEADYEATLAKLNTEISFMRDEFGSILRATEARADRDASELESVRAALSDVLSSTSWKMTGGLRRVMNLLKGRKASQPTLNIDTPNTPPRLEFRPKD